MKTGVKTFIVTLIASILFHSCSEKEDDVSRKRYVDENIPVNAANIPLDSFQNYYPYEIFIDTMRYKGSEQFIVKWFSKHLFALREPLLFNKVSKKESYRFLWLRTFHEPISIRIERTHEQVCLYWKQCDGAGGYEPGKLILNESKNLTLTEWNEFTSKIEAIDFWTARVNDQGGLDGSEWILEGATPRHYHVIYRWCPKRSELKGTDTERYYKACRYLIDLTDLEIEEGSIY